MSFAGTALIDSAVIPDFMGKLGPGGNFLLISSLIFATVVLCTVFSNIFSLVLPLICRCEQNSCTVYFYNLLKCVH